MKLLLILMIILGPSTFASAQNTVLSGVVYDQAGAAISETKITLTSNTGKKFDTFTNIDGIYIITVPSRNYSLEAVYLKHEAWERFVIEKYYLPPIPKMNLDITLRISEDLIKKYGSTLTIEPLKNKSKRKNKNN